MLRSDHPLLPVAAGLLLCLAQLGGILASWIVFVLVAGASVAICFTHRRVTPFFLFGIGGSAFIVGRTINTWTDIGGIAVAVDVLGLFFILIGIVRLGGRRIDRVEIETVLELLGMVTLLGIVVVVTRDLGVAPGDASAAIVVGGIATAVVLASSLFGRRSHPAVRWLVAAAACAALMQILLWDVSDRALALTAAGLPYIPLAIAARIDEEVTVEAVSDRRAFGRHQTMALLATMAGPILVLWHLMRAGNESCANIVLILGIIGTIAMALRVAVMVELRDWYVERERDVRIYGEDLVGAGSIDEALGATINALERLTERKALVGIVDLSEPGGELLASTGPTPGRPRAQGRSMPKAQDFGTRTRAELPDALYMVELAESLVAIDLPGGRPYLLFCAANHAFRPELVASFEEVANQLSVALETTGLRQEVHRERAHRQFKSLAQDSNELILVVKPNDFTVTSVGPTIDRLLGHSAADYLHQSVLQYVAVEDRAVAQRTLHSALQRSADTQCDIRVGKADGSRSWFAMSARPLEPDSEIQGVLVSLTNIHRRKTAESLVRRAEALYRTLVQKSTDIFVLVTPDLIIDYISPNVQNLVGCPAQDLLGAKFDGLLTAHSAELLTELTRGGIADLDDRVIEVEIRTAMQGSTLAEVALRDPELADYTGMLGIIRDVTARQHLGNSLQDQTTHDQLTGLLNRPSLERALQKSLHLLPNDGKLAVINLDLRNFKEVNDSAGFIVGNQLLMEVAGRLQSARRDEDGLARIVADEFAIIATGKTRQALIGFAERVKDLFVHPFHIADWAFKLEVAVGISIAEERSHDCQQLLQEATVAVHHAKAQPSDDIVVFEQSLLGQVDGRFELMTDMQTALANNEFAVVFQPLISFGSQEIRGFEALLRWNHPTRGNISPTTFIPLAEKSGVIVELGRWVLDRSCRQIVRWQRELEGFTDVQMAVNLSARQLERDGELEALLEIVQASGVNPADLIFELTESIMVKNASWIRSQLAELRGLGIEIAIDDVGTGTSGLTHLRELPFDIVKIDKSYVERVGAENVLADADSERMVSQILDLAKGLGARAVAEGVETPGQADRLARLGCDIGQGFYLAKPMDSGRIESWMQSRRRADLSPLSLDRQ